MEFAPDTSRARPLPVERTREPVKKWDFERTQSQQEGAGGFLYDPESGFKVHVTGTDQHGRYIPPDIYFPDGNTHRGTRQPPQFDLRDSDQLLKIFDLKETAPGSGTYFRRGFSGTYSLQKEPDGSFSVFYTGGTHTQGIRTPPQTFHHGFWDTNRAYTQNVVLPPPKPAPQAPTQQVTAQPLVATPESAAVAETISSQVQTPPPKLFDLSLPTGAPDPYHSEAESVKRTVDAASAVLSPEQLEALKKKYADKKLVAGSSELLDFFYDTISQVNDTIAPTARPHAASDNLREQLDLPEGTQVMLALSGGRNPSGLSEKDVTHAVVKAFHDTITLRGFRPPLAEKGDVVVVQAHVDPNGGPTLLRMSIVSGASPQRDNWKVTSYDAQFIPQLFSNVSDAVKRNNTPREQSFTDWATGNPNWHAPSSNPNQPTSLEQAFRKKAEEADRQAKIAVEQAAEETRRSTEGPKQSDVFMQVGRNYVMGYQGWTVEYRPDTNASFNAVEQRTGTIQHAPRGGLQFELTDSNGKKQSIRLSSLSQLEALPKIEKEILEYALTTPIEKDSNRSILRVVDLFPSESYRPGYFASFFYSHRAYQKELLDALVPHYESKSTAKEQRDFLSKLFGALRKEKSISEASASSIPQQF